MAVAKRIFQLAKEFECEEKKLIEFLTAQGIKVSNRLSAVNEDAYNLLKAKFAAPPPAPEPVSEPAPTPAQAETAPVEAPAEDNQQGKKKKKKNKSPQPDEQVQVDVQIPSQQAPGGNLGNFSGPTQAAYAEAIAAGNAFIEHYVPYSKAKKKKDMPKFSLSRGMDVWGVLQEISYDNPDSSPVRYWQAVNKLATKAFKLMQGYGMMNREFLADMRDTINPVGVEYEPQEIFTDEENQLFEAQRLLLFKAFGHGMGVTNEKIFALKMYAEHKKATLESMNFVEYLTNPDFVREIKAPMPFYELAEAVAYAIRGVPRRADFFRENKDRIIRIINDFAQWIDGYKTLKEQGAAPDKLEKYLYLEKKFISLVEFMAFDNLLKLKRNKLIPFDKVLDLLNAYRDDLDNPDAERNFKYKVRGIINAIQKPKEYVFLWSFADLEAQVDYRPPEEIAAAEAAAAEAAAAEAEAAATEDVAADESAEVKEDTES